MVISLLCLPAVLYVSILFWMAYGKPTPSEALSSFLSLFRSKPTQHTYKPLSDYERTNYVPDELDADCTSYPEPTHLYKGGGYHDYLNSDEWKAKRNLVLVRDQFRCVECEFRDTLQVHHKSYRHVYFEEENNYEDLITLCRECHKAINHKPILLTFPGSNY